ncbi:hypothetical protein C8J56DRAFT_893407 [Mycena floridula]|nr:hypothetical protein C8J56DRAFT_893407 [Mycena floridula]
MTSTNLLHHILDSDLSLSLPELQLQLIDYIHYSTGELVLLEAKPDSVHQMAIVMLPGLENDFKNAGCHYLKDLRDEILHHPGGTWGWHPPELWTPDEELEEQEKTGAMYLEVHSGIHGCPFPRLAPVDISQWGIHDLGNDIQSLKQRLQRSIRWFVDHICDKQFHGFITPRLLLELMIILWEMRHNIRQAGGHWGIGHPEAEMQAQKSFGQQYLQRFRHIDWRPEETVIKCSPLSLTILPLANRPIDILWRQLWNKIESFAGPKPKRPPETGEAHRYYIDIDQGTLQFSDAGRYYLHCVSDQCQQFHSFLTAHLLSPLMLELEEIQDELLHQGERWSHDEIPSEEDLATRDACGQKYLAEHCGLTEFPPHGAIVEIPDRRGSDIDMAYYMSIPFTQIGYEMFQ